MTHLDQALRALTSLRAEDRPGALSATQAASRARLEAAIRRAPSEAQEAAAVLGDALALRGSSPDATDPTWRTLVCALAAHALASGVPTTTVIQKIRADQLASDLAREPRLHGDPLAISEDRQLRLHEDIVQRADPERTLH